MYVTTWFIIFVQALDRYSNVDTSQDIEDTPIEEFEGIGTPVNQSFLNSLYCRVMILSVKV